MRERSWPAGRGRAGPRARRCTTPSRQLFAGAGLTRRPPARRRAAGDLARRPVRRGGRPRATVAAALAAAAVARRWPGSRAEGPAPLEAPVPGMATRERLHFAVVIPAFGRGSGGHSSIFQIVHWLERMGHTCTLWVYDPLGGRRRPSGPSVLRRRIVDRVRRRSRAPVFKGFADWHGADVVVATGWETVYPALLLDGCRARAYLVHDHEPEFFGTSVERLWAERTYREDLYPISSSAWLQRPDARPLRPRRLGVPLRRGSRRVPAARRRRAGATRCVFYGRDATPRRAVPLGLLALHELRRRRPDVRIVIFGERAAARDELPARVTRDRQPGDAGRRVRGGHRGPVPVDDQLLADPPGDDGLRPAVRGPGRREPGGGVRRGRPGGARGGGPRRARRRARAPAHRPTTCGAGARRPAWPSCATPTGSTRGRQVEEGLRAALARREAALLAGQP